MASRIDITVENPDDQLHVDAQGPGAVIVVESGTDEAGPFAAITGTTGIIPLVSGQRFYTARDPLGAVATWYRYRYEDVGAVNVSLWSPAFQVGDETGGFICSVDDVEQALGETLSPNDRENVLDLIRQVTVSIEGYCERWFVPRPLSGTATYRIHSSYGRVLRFPKGIRSVTTLGTANTGQPAIGGTYDTITDFYLDPPEMERSVGWPATRLVLLNGGFLYSASYGAEITGEFGWASVPADIQGVGVRAVIRKHIGKGSGGVSVAVGPAGTEFLLPDLSGSDRTTLNWYRSLT